MERECDNCGNVTSTKELGRKVRGEYLCKACKKSKRENHREETIEKSGIRDDLRELKNRIAREKRARDKKPKDYGNEGAPIPKGSKLLIKKKQTDCHLTLQERQSLFRMLIKRGIEGEEAKERVQGLVDSQRELAKMLRKEDTSEEEIKIKQQTLLEELWQE